MQIPNLETFEGVDETFCIMQEVEGAPLQTITIPKELITPLIHEMQAFLDNLEY